MQSKAATVEAYLDELPPDRRAAIQAVRDTILANLDEDYEEGMQYGMIGYYVPHRIFPQGYHCDPKQPVCFAGVASQKNHMAIYLMCVYGSEKHLAWFQDAWRKTGKKLDMGKSCIRFKKIEDIALDVVGEAIRRVPAAIFLENYTATLNRMSGGASAASSRKPAKKKATEKKKTNKKTDGKKTTGKKTTGKKATARKTSKKVAGKATSRKSAKKTKKR